MLRPRVAVPLLLLASCATAPKPSPAAPPHPPARATAERPQPPAEPPREPKIVPAQAILAPRITVVPPGTTVAPMPGMGGPPPLIIVPPPPEEMPEAPAPEQAKPPVPVIVNPPEAPEREPEEAAKRDKPPKPNKVDVADKNWKPPHPGVPRYRPCQFGGQGGPGPFKPERAPLDWIRCTYRCGRYRVELNDIRMRLDEHGKPTDAMNLCKEETSMKRAEAEARRLDDILKARGK